MTVFYQAENWTRFEYAFIDQDGDPIDISSATSVTLYIYTLTRTTRTVTGSYSVTDDKNLAVALATTIVNADMGSYRDNQGADTEWQFKVVLASGSEPVWSPRQKLVMHRNLG